jgi:hypothetical protein
VIGGGKMQNTQIVGGQLGWIGAAGLASIFFSLVVLWAVNDKYAFIALQLQLMTDKQTRTEQRLELLEVREQARQRRENERND